jgi:hypothetical protein
MSRRRGFWLPGPEILDAFRVEAARDMVGVTGFEPATCRRGDRSKDMVGVTGFEPATSWSQTRRSTKLSYTPTSFMLNMRRPASHAETSFAFESIEFPCDLLPRRPL